MDVVAHSNLGLPVAWNMQELQVGAGERNACVGVERGGMASRRVVCWHRPKITVVAKSVWSLRPSSQRHRSLL